jgi:hypothetical protein
MLTSTWSTYYNRGLRSLSRHHPAESVKFLQKALEACPPSRTRDLYHICFYLGVALRRIGYPQSCIKSWVSCQRLNKRGSIRRMISRFTNCYGMDRQISSTADDWQAFSSIQIARYLLSKNRRVFSTLAEQDMIRDLIIDSWKELNRSGTLEGKSGCEKIEAFRGIRIVFPSIVVSEPHLSGPIIGVNFRTKTKIALVDRCSCGSGMPYIVCCGRTPGKEEVLTGHF